MINQRRAKPAAAKIKPIDLRSITRLSDLCETRVFLQTGWTSKSQWITLGQVAINAQPRGWVLRSHLTDGVTDFEHDSAFALCLPLVGLQFEMVAFGVTILKGWIGADHHDDFRVPAPGYDPANHPDATICEDAQCGSAPHVIVPEGMYRPPFDPDLYEAVRGKEIEIRIGPRYPDQEK